MRWAITVGLAFLACVLFLTACDDSYGNKVERLEKFMSGNQIGSGADYWLVKGSFGVDDRVALVFGYMDDNAGCMEIAQMLNKKYPAANYTCKPANN